MCRRFRLSHSNPEMIDLQTGLNHSHWLLISLFVAGGLALVGCDTQSTITESQQNVATTPGAAVTNGSSVGSGSFTAHSIFQKDNSLAIKVRVADVNGDGHPDLVSATHNDNTIRWHENDGSGSFTTHEVTTSLEGPFDVRVADFDEANGSDLAATSFQSGIKWYENDGTQNFTAHQVSSTDASGLFASDLNGDGPTDLIGGASNVAWYENQGGQFSSEMTIGGDRAQDVHVADLNGDGSEDVVAATIFPDGVAWYENDGNQNFTRHVVATNLDTPNDVNVADVDGDGALDLLVATRHDHKVLWYENDGSGSFTTHLVDQLLNPQGNLYGIDPADLDEDGNLDFIVADFFNHRLIWYQNDGSENFTAHEVATGLDALRARDVHSSDLDGDGDPDLVAAHDDNVTWYENGQTEIEVDLAIMPESDPNAINPDSRGNVPAAILHTDDFNPVDRANVSSIRFGDPDDVDSDAGASPAHRGHVEDVDNDGDDDLVLHFPTEDTGFEGDEQEGKLVGETNDGTPLFGIDSVKLVGGGPGGQP